MKLRISLIRDQRTQEQKVADVVLREESAHLQALRVFNGRVADNIRRRIADGRFNPRNLSL